MTKNEKPRLNGRLSLANGRESFGNRKIATSDPGSSENRPPAFPDMCGWKSVSYTNQFPAMRDNPLEMVDRCQTAFSALDSSFRRQRRELMALIYGFAMIARDDPATMEGFMKKPFWKHRKYKVQSGILQLAMQYCLKAPNDDPKYGRACTYARGLSEFFDKAIPMEEIPDLIEKAGGIEKLAGPEVYRHADDPRNSRAASTGAAHRSQSVSENRGEAEGQDEPSVEVHASPHADVLELDVLADAGTDPTPIGNRPARASAPKPDWSCQILVELSPKQMSRAMNCRENERVKIVATVSGEPGKWRAFDATSVKKLPARDLP
ncbi:hypothetical protein [Mesorhizobium sp. CAU 1741]|uniref:hypothetical protein n=1 Tax=Mesorhizobium sp. CAU 1741 TaxID=3140366 RepID=UPI00325BC56C